MLDDVKRPGQSILEDRGPRLRDTERVELRRAQMDVPFFLLVILLLAIGVIMVLSASFASAYYDIGRVTGGNPTFFFFRQLIFAVSGTFLMYIASLFPSGFYQRMSFWSMLLALFLLVVVLVAGETVNNATRWINLGFTTFQPSEIAKVAVVLVFSNMVCVYKEKMKSFKYGILPFALLMALIVFLLMLQPHISASVIILAAGASIMFIGGVRLGWVFAGIAAVGVGGWVIINQFSHAISRLAAWQDPFASPLGGGWQIIQSLYAIGSGGALGLGLGQSRQKFLYLPEEHNDYIFAIVAEELGFVGAMLILCLFAILIIRGYWIALHARTKFGSLVASGLTSLLAIQVFLNVGVVTNLLPSTGISLPFFSYGGTALWFKLISMGIILSISREIPAKREG